MAEQLNSIIPNVMEKLPEFLTSIKETFIMVGWSGIISFILGLLLGVTITVTKPGNIMSNPVVYHAIDKVVNFFRSIPFIILLAGLVPLTRLIMGTAIGVEGAIVPLVFGCTPFFTRQIESALADVSPGLIEAAQSMGSGKLDIIIKGKHFRHSESDDDNDHQSDRAHGYGRCDRRGRPRRFCNKVWTSEKSA